MGEEKIYGSLNRKKLYDNLSQDYDLGTFDDFNRNMDDEGTRLAIYQAGLDAGWELPAYDQFAKDMTVRQMKVNGQMQEVDHDTYNKATRVKGGIGYMHDYMSRKAQKPQQKVVQPHQQEQDVNLDSLVSTYVPQQPAQEQYVNAEDGMTYTQGGLDSLEAGYTPQAVPSQEPVQPQQPKPEQPKPQYASQGAPYRPDHQTPMAQRAEAYKQNDFMVDQMEKFLDKQKAYEEKRNSPIVRTGNEGVDTYLIKSQKNFEREIEQGASKLSQSVVIPTVDKVIADYEKKAHEAFVEAQRGSTGAGMPTGVAGGFQAVGAQREANKVKDPEKILADLAGQMEKYYTQGLSDTDKEFIEKAFAEADSQGLDREMYLEYIMKPQILSDLENYFANSMIAKELPKSSLEYIVNGLGDSIFGMLVNAYTETEGQRFYKNQAEAKMEEGKSPYYNPGTGAKLGRMGVSFAADAPFFGVFGKVSGAVAKKVAERQIKNLMAKGLSETAARSIVGAALENSVGARMKQYLMQHVISSSLTLGMYNAASESARQARDSEFDPLAVAESAGEGLMTGAAFGATGGAMQAVTQPLRGIYKIGGKLAGFGVEGETMYATEELAKMMHGQEGFDNPFEGSLEAMMKLGVIKASGGHLLKQGADKVIRTGEVGFKQAVQETLGKIFGQQHTGVKFTDRERDYVINSTEGQNLVEALTTMHPEVAISEANGKKTLTPEGEAQRQQLSAAYDGFMQNPEIPANVKQKVAAVLGGVYRPGLETGADIIHNADGSVVLKTRDKDGNCVQEFPFNSFTEADNARDEMMGLLRHNDAVNMFNGTTDEQRVAIVNDVAQTFGKTFKEAKKLVYDAMENRAKKGVADEQYDAVIDAITRLAYPRDEYNPAANFQQGKTISAEDRHLAMADVQVAEEQLMLFGEDFANEVMTADNPDEKMAELAMRPDVTGDMIKAAVQYYNDNARLQGMMQEAVKSIDEQVNEANAKIQRNTHSDLGVLIMGTANGRNVYVNAGHLEITPDGKLISTDGSQACIVRDAETDEIDVVNPEAVRVYDIRDPRPMIEANESMDGLRGQLTQQVDDTIEYAPGTPMEPSDLGEIFVGLDGQQYMVSGQQDATGAFTYLKIPVDETGTPIGQPQPLDINEYRKAKSNEIDAANRPEETLLENQEVQQTVVPETEAPVEQPVQTPAQETGVVAGGEAGREETRADEPPVAAQPRIPVNEKGQPIYEQARPEDTLADLNMTYGEEGAQTMITRLVENISRKLAELETADLSDITDINEMKAHSDEVKALREKLAYWQGLVKAPVVEPVVDVQPPVVQAPAKPVTPPAAPQKPVEPQKPAEPQYNPAEEKIYRKTVDKNIGRTFTFTDANGVTTEITIERVDHEGNAVLTRRDYDAQGNPVGEAREQRVSAARIGEGIFKKQWKKALTVEERLRKVNKFYVGGVNLVDVLTDEEQRELLRLYESGDKIAIGNRVGELSNEHRDDIILKGRDMRNEAVEKGFGKSNRAERLRAIRQQYQGFDNASSYLANESMEPQGVEEWVAELLGDVPKAGTGVLAYESYGDGQDKVIGLKDETGLGKRGFGGDTKGFNPWLAPKGKGMSLARFAENIRSQMPEAMQEQYSDQDIRNIVLDILTGAEKPTDISNYILRNRVDQAEAEARRAEDEWMEQPNFQKVIEDRSFAPRLQRAKESVNVEPTEGQKKAGNYKMGHISFGGYDYTIENPKGSVRRGKDANGKPWENTMANTYGYILGKKGKDGDNLDMFINDDADLDNWNGTVYVIDQVDPKTGKFDEHKVMYGFNSEAEARAAYLANYAKGWKGLGNITGVDKATFDKWLDSSDRKLKEFAEHSIPKNHRAERLTSFDSALRSLDEREISIDDAELLEKYGLKSVILSRLSDHLTLTHFIVDEQGQGNGSRFMEDLARLADEKGWTLCLTPDTSFGATSVKRLKDFYKRFGFKDNKGRNTDFGTRESMVRRPKDWVPATPTQKEQTLRDAVIEHLRSKGIKVSTDWQLGQKILDDYNRRFAAEEAIADEDAVKTQKVTDQAELDMLNNGPTVKRYRAMQLIDGKLYPPMSGKIDGKWREPTEIGVWERSEERPDLLDKNGKFKLRKGLRGKGRGDTPAAYNPYFHTSTSGLNDQFTAAYQRPELVVVEVEIPESELTSGYQAMGAKDHVGDIPWHSGPVNGQLPEDRKRTVTLSRWSKVNRVVPDSEVADMIAKQLEGTGIEVPYNVVTPALRAELEKRGVKISATPSGSVTEDINGNPIKQQKVGNAPIFISNAMRAVEAIKQEKATPEQWLAMIQKGGGLKAGEDKWLGLSDWLNGDGKDAAEMHGGTITKQEILDYIRKNQIQVEEQHYAEGMPQEAQDKLDAFNDEFEELIWQGEEATGSIYTSDWVDWAYEQMIDRYGDDFRDAFDIGEGSGTNSRLTPSLDYTDNMSKAAEYYLGIDNGAGTKPIDTTRLDYTTNGLTNKREIALTVPTIEPWNEGDNIHFGDAGEGRAVAWVRFGDANVPIKEPVYKHADEFEEPWDNGRGSLVYWPKGMKGGKDYIVYGKMRDGSYRYGVMINEAGIGVYDTFEEARENMNTYYRNHPKTQTTGNQKVLVIDEIQSKRHQEGREKGYKIDPSPNAPAVKAYNDAEKEYNDYASKLRRKYGRNDLTGILTDEENAKLSKLFDKSFQARINYNHYLQENKLGPFSGSDIPDAPFEKNWHELAMKRMLRYAAENGYDKIAWTTGAQQAERYDLSDKVDEIKVAGGVDNIFTVIGIKDGGILVQKDVEGEKGLAELIGKNMARKAYSNLKEGKEDYLNEDGAVSFTGDDLVIGGEGMKGFYDDMLPRFMNKYGKKWGVKVGEVEIPPTPNANDALTMHSIDVTPEMKESVMEGQPMFFRTPDGNAYGYTYKGQIYVDPRIATAETPIHEYGHLWAEMKRNTSPEEWEHIKQVMLTDKLVQPIIDRVKRDYPELTKEGKEDQFIEEIITQFSGQRGAERLRAIAEEVAAENGGVFGKAEAITAMQRLKNILNRFWEGVAKMMGWEYRNANQIADRIMADWLNGVDPREQMERAAADATGTVAEQRAKDHKQQQLDIILRENPADDANMPGHTWIRSIDDIKTYEEALEDDGLTLDEDVTPDFTADMVKEALETGTVTVYSSKPIKDGTFVTPSKMEAENYAGGGKVYSKEVSLDDVAWIDGIQGQYAKVPEKINQQKVDYDSAEEKQRTETIFNAAKKLFGTTRDIREAGYVLPDGTMPDFSGRHIMNPGSDTSFLRGRRTTDHRDINSIAYERDGNTKTGIETDMPDFIRRGAIRIDNISGNINLSTKPTDKQRAILRQLIAYNDGYVQVDFGDGWDSDHYVEYSDAKASRILADIDRYFDEGIKPQGDEIKYQLVGKEGAEKADNAEGNTKRQDNLKLAEEAEKYGYDAKAIKFATGWERGVDGRWRYEIPDADADILGAYKKARQEHDKEYARLDKEADNLQERYQNLNARIPQRLDSRYTEEQKAMYREMRKQREKLWKQYLEADKKATEFDEKGISLTLGELLGDGNELFKYYPELKDTKVTFPLLQDGTAGSYGEDGIKVGIDELRRFDNDELNNENVYATLLHEVQHAIQDIEGFAKGGNLYTSTTDEGINAILEKKQRHADDIKRHLDANNKILNNPDELKEFAELEGKSEQEFKEHLMETVDQEAAEYDNLKLQIEHLKANRTPTKSEALDVYHRLSGEVESRNVSNRMKMTDQERLATLASETEDVPRDEQIIIMGNGEAMNINDIKPIGSNRFGGVYDQFKGKVKEAFDFLTRKKDGYLKGVFHRDDLGDIDLAWGSAPTDYTGKGLSHIIRKHIKVMKDFKDLDEAMRIIEDVINNGALKPNKDPKLVNIENGDYRVVVAKNEEGNWILSAFDFVTPKSKKGKTLPPSKTPGQSDVEAGAVTSNLSLSGDKDNKNINTIQENGEKSAIQGLENYSEDDVKDIDKMLSGEITPEEVEEAMNGNLVKQWLGRNKDTKKGFRENPFNAYHPIIREMAKATIGWDNRYEVGGLFNNAFEYIDDYIKLAKENGLDAKIADKYDFHDGDLVRSLIEGDKPMYTNSELASIEKCLKPKGYQEFLKALKAVADEKLIQAEEKRIREYDGGNAITKALALYHIAIRRMRDMYEKDERFFRPHTVIDGKTDLRYKPDYQPKEGEAVRTEYSMKKSVADELMKRIATMPISEKLPSLPGRGGQSVENAEAPKFQKAPGDIHSENFKKYFGDWENDPENSSKVVDDKGKPLVVYKRTADNPNTFDTKYGSFFSNEPIDDKSFGEHIGKYFLNIRKPLVIDAQGEAWSYPLWRILADKDGNLPQTQEEYEKVLEKRHLLDIAPKEVWDIVMRDDTEYEFDDLGYIIKQNNLPYDGVIIRNIGESQAGRQKMDDYIALEPTQIKSATDNNGEYDSNNPDIRFQKTDEEKLNNRYEDEKSEDLFLSLPQKEGNDYNETVSEITRRVVSREARLRTGDEPVEVSGPAPVAFRTIAASVGRPAGRMEEVGPVLQTRDRTRQVESVGRTDGSGNTPLPAEGQGKRERAEKRIESWAKENGYWIDEDEFAKNAEKVKDGTESHVYKTADGKYVKFTEPNVRAYDEDDLLPFFEGVDIFNKLFSENPIKIIGASRDDNGVFRFVCEQPEVKGKRFEYDETDESLQKAFDDYYDSGTFDKVVDYFDKLGLRHDENNDGVFYNDKYVIADVPFENIVVGNDGKIHVIDADCEYTPEYRYDHKIGELSVEGTGQEGQPMFQREGQVTPEITPEDRQYWNQWQAAMKKWRERNAIAEGVDGPMEKPRYQPGENALEYGKRLAQWNRDKALWQTAPKLDDYKAVRDDKEILEDARDEEKRYPHSEGAKRRRVAAELSRLRHAMSRQKAYDKATVKAVTDFANDFMKMGFGDNLSRGEIERMLSSVKNATGSKDVKKYVDNIMNILMDNHLRNLENRVWKLASVKELKQNAQGVETQGKLELKGQKMIQAFREATQSRMTAEDIRNRMAEVAERMTANDEEAPMWEQEYEGLAVALQYVEDIDGSRQEWADLDREYKEALRDYRTSGRSYQAQQELLESIEQAMMENKVDRIGYYGSLIGRLEGNIVESIEGAKEFVQREKDRIAKIQRIANYDLAGKDMGAIHQNNWKKRLANSTPARFFLAPLGTFEMMLKQFGARNANGEGNLYNYFMRSWIDSVDKAYTNEQAAKAELDAKAKEVFGKAVKRWSDLYEIERKLPTMDVEVIDQGEKKRFTLTQGNLLYIYMANKMADGKMKLRKMGIDDAEVEAIADFLDPRLKELGDWLQDEYLVNRRVEYNKVHERMFGAPMAAIDNYFPIKILGDARVQEQDVANMADQDAVLPSTITGSIVKRRRNSLPLDILGTDALSLAIEHIEDMERWAATAEFNKDINTLLSYTTFRNKVKNMTTIYGSGDQLWNTFADAARMAAGTYRPKVKPGSVDKSIANIAKGVTAAKINFRVYTAFKQILSAPAFLHDVNLGDFVKDAANPYGCWKWAMENMPVFAKRWKSRQVGDTRLMDDPTDWKLWHTNIVQMATRMGMSPNALVDGVTCAVGARAIYQTRYKKYKKLGASDEVANKRALQDAEIGYNETQQSSEGAFVSAIQKDRTVAAIMLSVFRNSSMAYTRQWVDAMRNLSHRSQKGYKEDAINFMANQFKEAFDMSDEKAKEAAQKEYARAARHDVARLLNMMFGVTFAWNLGASLPYLLMGDDDETKKEMMEDAAIRAFIAGPSEGLTAGNLYSDFISRTAASEETRRTIAQEGWGAGVDAAMKQGGDYEVNPLPLMADIQSMIKKMGYDKYAAAQDVFNICMQASVGVNPQTFTDMWNACLDYGNPDWMPFTSNHGNDDLANSKEIALFIMRLMNAPTSSWRNKYIDELGMNVEDAKKLPYEEMAARYANYKHWKDAPLMGWLRSDEARQEKMDKIRKQFDDAVKQRMERLDDDELKHNLARTESTQEKRMYAKIIAQRLGLEGKDAQKATTDWQAAYQKQMLYDDIREDELLSQKLKEVKEVDEKAAKKIERLLKYIREGQYEENEKGRKVKDASLVAPGKKQFGGGASDEEIMKNIRRWRKEALEIALKVKK